MEGNLIDEWLNDEVKTYAPEKIVEAEDNSLLFVGRYFTGTSSNGFPLSQGYICKVDSLNNREWSLKTGKPTFPTDMNNLIPTMDGNYIAIGVTLDSLSSSQVLTESGHIIKFNIEGEIIWERRHYGIDTEGEYNKPYDIVELADSSLLICGESVDVLGDFPYRGWLLKLDKYGNLDTLVSVTTPQHFSLENNLLVYPNPAKDWITISLEDHQRIYQAEIFDTAGRRVEFKKYEGDYLGKLNFDITHLEAAMYILKVNGKYLKKVYVY